jgi:hypothetical protein
LGIKFCPTVHRTLWEIQRYCYDTKTNLPIDKDDHMMENLYRLMINNPTWQNPEDYPGPIGDDVLDQVTISPRDEVDGDMSLD